MGNLEKFLPQVRTSVSKISNNSISNWILKEIKLNLKNTDRFYKREKFYAYNRYYKQHKGK